MKKLVILLLVFFVVGCNVSTTKVNIKGLQNIEYDTLSKLMKEKKQFMLYIGRDDCGDCQSFKPILEDYLNKNKDAGLYYLNIKEFRDASRKKNATKKEKDFFNNLYKTFKFDWTPTLEIITNGKIGKQYQYLNEDYYKIKDREKQIKEKEKFIKQFKQYMNNYFKGE